MAEEHRCHAEEGHRLCVNNCGFFGSPATMNLCSKCYGDFRLKETQQAASIISSLSSSSSSSSSMVTESFPKPPALTSPEVSAGDLRNPVVLGGGDEVVVDGGGDEVVVVVAQPNRCFVCRKRVGLTGFKCRCGTTFCGTHRYPEKHDCTFDFKKVGREEIARANPLVKAEKLEKI